MWTDRASDTEDPLQDVHFTIGVMCVVWTESLLASVWNKLVLSPTQFGFLSEGLIQHRLISGHVTSSHGEYVVITIGNSCKFNG